MPERPPQTLPEHVADLARRMRKVEVRQATRSVAQGEGCCECVGGRAYLDDADTQTIENNMNVGVEFNASKLLTGGVEFYAGEQGHGPGLIVPDAGVFIASVGAAWNGDSNVGYRQLRIWCYDPADGTTAIFVSQTLQSLATAGPVQFQAFSQIFHPEAGWAFAAEVVQSSGGQEDIMGDDLAHHTFLEVQRIAPCTTALDVAPAPEE